MALCIELRCRELRHVSKALRLGVLRSNVLRTENVEGCYVYLMLRRAESVSLVISTRDVVTHGGVLM